MSTLCKYKPGRIVDVDYKSIDDCTNLRTKDRYNIILIKQGFITFEENKHTFSFLGPCVVCLKESSTLRLLTFFKLIASTISFDVSFLNVNITYDLINSNKYEACSEQYGFIPLNIFYNKNDQYYGYIPVVDESIDHVKNWFDKFEEAISSQTDERWSCRARLNLNNLIEFLFQLQKEYTTTQITPYNTKDKSIWIANILEYIHSNYHKNISLITISKNIKINKTTVGEKFKEITGFSVTDYIINYRVKCASYSIATTNLKYSEIAHECGFKTISYFMRQFKNKTGITVGQYKHKCLKEREVV